MKVNDATEAAYKNGYADGVKETEEKLMLEVRDLRIELKAERAIAKVHKAEIERLQWELIKERTRRENAEKACHDAYQRTADAIKKRLSRGHIHSVLIQECIDATRKKLEREGKDDER